MLFRSFRVFGSEAWVHIPNEKHKALEQKSEKCIFVGYSEDVKGYRLLHPNSKGIIIRTYVKFMKMFWPTSLIRHMCLLLSTTLI